MQVIMTFRIFVYAVIQATAILILFKCLFVEQPKVYLVIGSLCKETLNRSNKVISLLYGAQ